MDDVMARTLHPRQAKEMIAERLDALGHAPDFLAPDAVDELLRRSRSAPQALNAALSATLFLASTEDVVVVGRDLVERAVPADLGDYAEAPRAPGPRVWRLAYLAVPLILACAVAAIWPRKPATPPPVPKPQAVKQVPPPAPPAPAKTPQKEIVARKPPGPPPAAPDSLPSPPPVSVTLLVAPPGGAEQGPLPALLASLLPAGFGQVDVRPAPAAGRGAVPPQRHRVAYFFQQDEALAQEIAKRLNEADAAQPPWQPFLAKLPLDAPPPPPGSIEADAR